MFSSDTQESATARLRKDVTEVGGKFVYVLTKACYAHRGEELAKWDLFGPFLISLLLPLIVYFPRPVGDANAQNLSFALLFTFLWFMAFICSLNACLVGTYMDYLPFMSTIIYELVPILVSSLLGKFLPFMLKAVAVTGAVIYSLILSKRTFEGHMIKDKWILVYKPIVFMYVTAGCLVMFNS